jgi:hypothetical protein
MKIDGEEKQVRFIVVGLLAILGMSAWVCGAAYIGLHFVTKYW